MPGCWTLSIFLLASLLLLLLQLPLFTTAGVAGEDEDTDTVRIDTGDDRDYSNCARLCGVDSSAPPPIWNHSDVAKCANEIAQLKYLRSNTTSNPIGKLYSWAKVRAHRYFDMTFFDEWEEEEEEKEEV